MKRTGVAHPIEIAAAREVNLSLRFTLAAALIVLAFDLSAILLYLAPLLRRGLVKQLIVTSVMGLLVYGVGRVISGAVLKERGYASVPKTAELSVRARRVRFIVLAAGAVCLELVIVLKLAPKAGQAMLFNLIFYLAFFGCGVLLSRDQDSETAPVLFGLVVSVVLAGVLTVIFLTDPASAARYGADRTAVGVRTFIIHANALPLEIAITWAAWRVSRVNRLRPATPAKA